MKPTAVATERRPAVGAVRRDNPPVGEFHRSLLRLQPPAALETARLLPLRGDSSPGFVRPKQARLSHSGRSMSRQKGPPPGGDPSFNPPEAITQQQNESKRERHRPPPPAPPVLWGHRERQKEDFDLRRNKERREENQQHFLYKSAKDENQPLLDVNERRQKRLKVRISFKNHECSLK